MPFTKGHKINVGTHYTMPIERRRKIGLANKGKIRSNEAKLKYSLAHKGKKITAEHKQKISQANKGHVVSNKTKIKIGNANRGRKLGIVPKKAYKKGSIPWNKGLQGFSYGVKGERNHNWKGGTTPLYKKIRKSLEYRLWRVAVFERDNYTCIWCGQKGGKLNADHIKPFAFYPELRFAIDNGRTLCIDCHKTTETYGGRAKKFV